MKSPETGHSGYRERTMARQKPHPLEPLVLQALARNGGYLDEVVLAYFLIGDDGSSDAYQAYERVAFDLLTYMESEGWLEGDAHGWWSKVPKPAVEQGRHRANRSKRRS